MLRFAAVGIGGQFGQQTIRLTRLQLPDARIHGPARAARFHNCADTIQPHVAKLRFTGRSAVKNLPIHDQPAAHAAAECDIEDRIQFHPRSI